MPSHSAPPNACLSHKEQTQCSLNQEMHNTPHLTTFEICCRKYHLPQRLHTCLLSLLLPHMCSPEECIQFPELPACQALCSSLQLESQSAGISSEVGRLMCACTLTGGSAAGYMATVVQDTVLVNVHEQCAVCTLLSALPLPEIGRVLHC